MKNKGKKILIIICMLAIVFVCGIFAYFTDIEIANNLILTGFVDIELSEYRDTNNNAWENVTNVMPGNTITKIAKISKKSSSANCYIRAKVEYSGDIASSISIDDTCLALASGWTKCSDGYYYYEGELTDTTPVTFFTAVTIPAGLSNSYANKSLILIVTAEAIQSANFVNTAPWTDGANAIVVSDYDI